MQLSVISDLQYGQLRIEDTIEKIPVWSIELNNKIKNCDRWWFVTTCCWQDEGSCALYNTI